MLHLLLIRLLPWQVFESFQPAMIGVFSENPEECPNCAGLAKEFKKAAENLVIMCA